MKPFKVVCINDKFIRPVHPIKGEIYTVIGLETHHRYKGWYFFAELSVPDGDGIAAYKPSAFRPISDCGPAIAEWIEETHFKELEYQEACQS